MQKSVLIVMIDVLVLSVLTMTVGKREGGAAGFILPAHRWSEVIEQGLAKEQALLTTLSQMESRIAEERRRADEATELAKLAMQGQDSQREETTEALKKTEELETALAGAEAARQKAEQEAEIARLRSEQARQDAEASNQRERESREKALAHEAEARAAEQRANDALEKEKKAALALERTREQAKAFESRAEEARQRETAALENAKAIEAKARELEQQRTRAGVEAELAREAELAARNQEKSAREKIELALVREGAALERARLADADRARLMAEMSATQEKVGNLKADLASISLKEQFALEKLKDAEQAVSTLQEDLREQEEQKNRSVWVQREQTLRFLQITMAEDKPDDTRNIRRKSLYLPLVRSGTFTGIVGEFESLGFGLSWWTDRIDNRVDTLVFSLSPPVGDMEAAPIFLRANMLVDEAEPRLCLIEAPEIQDAPALTAVGMERVKTERIQQAMLFKCDAPDTGMEVSITPLVGTDFIVVRKTDTGAPERPAQGDYLMTPTGEFIGVMVTAVHAVVLPASLPAADTGTVLIPLDKDPGETYYTKFMDGLNRTRELIKASPSRIKSSL